MLANGLNTFKLDDAAYDNQIPTFPHPLRVPFKRIVIVHVPGMKHFAISFALLYETTGDKNDEYQNDDHNQGTNNT